MQPVEVLRLGGLDGAHVADAGVVHQNVEAVEFGRRRGNGVRAGDVEMQRLCGADRVGERFGGGDVDVGDPDEGSGADEFLDGGFADAAGAARDQCVAAVETKRVSCCAGV